MQTALQCKRAGGGGGGGGEGGAFMGESTIVDDVTRFRCQQNLVKFLVVLDDFRLVLCIVVVKATS